MIRSTLILTAAILPLTSTLTAARARAIQDPPPQTRPVPANTESLQATITALTGIVQVRSAEDQPWQKAEIGMVLGEGAEFRTGPKSIVQFTLPPDQTVTLDRLGTIKLLEAIRAGNRIKTDLGMQYGRVRYAIEAAGQEHDSTIRSPGSTLAVRGTDVVMNNSLPFPVQVTSLTGRAYFRPSRGPNSYFGGPNAGTITIEEGKTAPETALFQTFIDPTSSIARTTQEQQAFLNVPILVGSSPTFPAAIVEQPIFTTPVTPPPPPFPSVRGSLLFQLVWVESEPTKGSFTPDLDLFILTPRGENLCAKGCPPTVPSGGRSPVDDVGAGEFGFGEEVALFPRTFPLGKYEYGVRHVKGQPAEFQLAILRDGELIAEPVTGTVDAKNNRARFDIDITRKAPPPPEKPQEPQQPSSARKAPKSSSKPPAPGKAIKPQKPVRARS